jgi:transcriptional regulator with XRE-family HTH domain
MSITTAQIRGARGILNWSQQDLAQRTGISATSIGSIENGQTTPRESTLQTIRSTLEGGGIEFIGTDGIRKKSAYLDIWRGNEGFKKLSNDMFETIKLDKQEVLQAYVDDRKFAAWLGDESRPHVDRMKSITLPKFKILQKEGDVYFPAKDYAEYKWIPENQFMAVPFFVYGNKLAIILFGDEANIIVMNYPMVAKAYRFQFSTIWDQAMIPPKELIENWQKPEKPITKLADIR